MPFRRSLTTSFLLGLAAGAGAVTPADEAYFKSEIRPILSTFCLECHKEGKQIDFLAVKELSQIHSQRGNLRSAVTQLRNRTMPPAKEEQPSEDDRRKAADWLEREVWALFGIQFAGHPDLRRLVMPDEFTAHPLRKDYPLQGRGERHNFPVITRDHS